MTEIKYPYSVKIPEEIQKKLLEWAYLYVETTNSPDPKQYIDTLLNSARELITRVNHYLDNPKRISDLRKSTISRYVSKGIIEKAKGYKKNGKYSDAIILFERARSLNELEIEPLLEIADCYYYLLRFNDSIKYLNMIIQIRPDHSGVYNNLSICYTELNDLIKAEEFAETAHKLKPSCPDYLYTLGCVKSKLGKNEEALELLKQADFRDAGKNDIMHALADSYIAVKQTDKAVRLLERMILLFPNDPYCFFDLGIIYRENKLYNNGLDYLQRSLKLAPDDPVIYYNIAALYKETGRDNLAVDIYMQALLRNPKLTVDFWEDGHLLLDLDIPLEFKYGILSFGAEYGDENAKKVLDEKTWLRGEEEEY